MKNLGYYMAVITTALIFAVQLPPFSLPGFLIQPSDPMLFWMCRNSLMILVLPAIFAGIYYLVKRKGFSKVFAWATVILCVISYYFVWRN